MIKRFEIAINDSAIQFDRDYGMDKRTGWSIAIKGHFECQLERFLIVAIIKTIYQGIKHGKHSMDRA